VYGVEGLQNKYIVIVLTDWLGVVHFVHVAGKILREIVGSQEIDIKILWMKGFPSAMSIEDGRWAQSQ
jgi:hypothetical protein